ncbi:hypothetical protein QR680_010115 [Steinernema hermaphroditum]|uniref:Palmitoyltransferase n=1 Tax=Steinernema hermaphroditum TaxID=289476 RepID=A0AA39IP14_9BILA|nr:hypothetical protein QR680_010115 [Steinernema hermaphroditum]
MDKFCERLCSKLVVAVVSLLIISVFLTVYFVFVPFEYYHKGLYHFLFLFVFGIYLFVNVLYHYYQSCFKSPGFAPKVSGSPLCWQCGHYKPSNAHHCTECNRCVLRMDHHCVFIGQCVGLYNHRHFFQFVGFLGLSCLTAVLSGTNTFWYNVAMIPLNNNELAFCNVVSDDYFLKSLICWDRRGLIVTQLVVCTYSLCLTGMGVGFLFFTWNAILISADTTHVDSTKNGTWTAMFRSMKNFSNVRQNWASFLGLNSRRRSFFWHILLPSSHAPIVGDPSIEKRLSSICVK